MVKRVLLIAGLAAGAAALSGCVVVAEPGYGYGAAPAVVRVAPPPVVVVPPSVHQHRHRHRYGPWWR